MTSLNCCLPLILLQPGTSPLMSDMLRFTVITGICIAVLIVVMYFTFRALKPKTDQSLTASLREEFEKSKDALLLAAQSKRAALESDEAARKQAESEEREKELLRANVDPGLVIGKTCPLCGLDMTEDQELVIDPYTGQGYHFSSFLNDWPHGQPRPKYVYRYPQGTVVKSTNLVVEY